MSKKKNNEEKEVKTQAEEQEEKETEATDKAEKNAEENPLEKELKDTKESVRSAGNCARPTHAKIPGLRRHWHQRLLLSLIK